MSVFSKFLKKFVPEYRQIGEALGTIVAGVALDPAERAAVSKVVDLVNNAADSIEKSLANVEKLDKGGVSKSELKKAIKEVIAEMLPDIIGGVSEASSRKALKNETTGA